MRRLAERLNQIVQSDEFQMDLLDHMWQIEIQIAPECHPDNKFNLPLPPKLEITFTALEALLKAIRHDSAVADWFFGCVGAAEDRERAMSIYMEWAELDERSSELRTLQRPEAMAKLTEEQQTKIRDTIREVEQRSAELLIECDPDGIAKRIDAILGSESTNIIMVYLIAFVLQNNHELLAEFQAQIDAV